MKRIYKSLVVCLAAIAMFTIAGCDKFLDVTPPSTISPESYLWDESHLAAYTINYYNFADFGENPAKSINWDDMCTDNAVGRNGDNRFMPGQQKVDASGGGWSFTNIRSINFFIETVQPRYEGGELKGDNVNNGHYLGEAYFLRAYEYFAKLKDFGDFPIIEKTLPDEVEALVEASKRQPRNEVARFILSDLDKAIDLLQPTAPQGGRTRINRNVALIFKSRVALFEATWLKYHKGTAMVPLGAGWPGANADYLKGYNFPSGSIDSEIDYFLGEAMSAAKEVADAVPLTANNKTIRSTEKDPVNPYYDMFACVDPADYPEAVMYRTYSIALSTPQKHGWNGGIYFGYSAGYTQQYADVFLMENGLPIYAPGSGYAGDDYIEDTKVNRDWRWRLFMKAPGEPRGLVNVPETIVRDTFPNPAQIDARDYTRSTSTGYLFGKGQSPDYQSITNDVTAFVIFKASEAYLNYIEACYEKNGSINSDATKYWQALRTRAGVDADFNKTISATDMSKEALNDWGAYSHGALINATLYNIRRERRCEFIGEGRRFEDLIRWRALDQLYDNPFFLKGCKVWGPMQNLYTEAQLKHDQPKDADNLMSSPSMGEYLIPLSVTKTNNLFFDGLKFCNAHYLKPIAAKHFVQTADDFETPEKSVIYQNPDWPLIGGEGPKITK